MSIDPKSVELKADVIRTKFIKPHVNVGPPWSLVLSYGEDQALPVCQAIDGLDEPFSESSLPAKHRTAVVLQGPRQNLHKERNAR